MTIAITQDTAAEERWNSWKRAGQEGDVRRKERMRKLMAAICVGGVTWLLSRAF